MKAYVFLERGYNHCEIMAVFTNKEDVDKIIQEYRINGLLPPDYEEVEINKFPYTLNKSYEVIYYLKEFEGREIFKVKLRSTINKDKCIGDKFGLPENIINGQLIGMPIARVNAQSEEEAIKKVIEARDKFIKKINSDNCCFKTTQIGTKGSGVVTYIFIQK